MDIEKGITYNKGIIGFLKTKSKDWIVVSGPFKLMQTHLPEGRQPDADPSPCYIHYAVQISSTASNGLVVEGHGMVYQQDVKVLDLEMRRWRAESIRLNAHGATATSIMSKLPQFDMSIFV